MDQNFIKNYWFWVVVILVFSVSMFYVKLDLPSPAVSQASLIVNFGDDKIRQFEGPAEQDTTILQALYSSSMGGNFEFIYSVDQNNHAVVASIGGIPNNGVGVWNFYLNKTKVPTEEISVTKVQAGDLVEVKYE